MSRTSTRLPKRFPIGTTYVVEGRAAADGLFHVSARYVLLPTGRKVSLPATPIANLGSAPSIVPRRPRPAQRRSRTRADATRLGAS
jgi:hypothetical protein